MSAPDSDERQIRPEAPMKYVGLLIALARLGLSARGYDRVLVPEMNTGQLAQILRAEFLVDVESYCKLEGKPLFAAELEREILERL